MEKTELNRETESANLKDDDLVKVVVVGDRYALIPKDSNLPTDSLPIHAPTEAAFEAGDWEFFNNEYHLALQEGWV